MVWFLLIAWSPEALAQATGGSVLASLERAFAGAAEKIAPSVVAIEVERDAGPSPAPPPLPPPGHPPREEEPAYAKRPPGPVSGLAVGTSRILTSAFNVEGAKRVEVILGGGRRIEARVLGRDEALDLALLELAPAAGVPGAVLMPARFSEAAAPRVGAFLVAVGRTGAGELLVNSGIVSALGRFRGDALQTDAALNFGNFGGAAVDVEGRLFGVPVRIAPRAGINSGVAFVVPIARIRDIMPDLERGLVRRAPPRAFLGVQFGRELLDPPGVEVTKIVDGSAAARAGLEKGDVLRRVGDVESFDIITVSDAIQARRPGDTIRLEVDRGGRRIGFEVRLGERAAER